MGRLRALVVCACVQGLLFGPAAASARPLLGDQPQSVADRYVPQPPGIPVSTWVSGLEVPWSLVFPPDGRALVSERRGRIRLIAANGTMDPVPYATFRHDLLQGRSDDGDAEERGFASHRVQLGRRALSRRRDRALVRHRPRPRPLRPPARCRARAGPIALCPDQQPRRPRHAPARRRSHSEIDAAVRGRPAGTLWRRPIMASRAGGLVPQRREGIPGRRDPNPRLRLRQHRCWTESRAARRRGPRQRGACRTAE